MIAQSALLCITATVLFLLGHCNSSSRTSSRNYIFLDLLDICPRDRSKLEVPLGTQSAVLFAEVPANGFPGGQTFTCHLELEAKDSNYGFHIFMEEMNLLGSERGDDCGAGDYIQFARDELFLTTHKSPRYCGHRLRINSSNKEAAFRKFDGEGIRFYVEERDSEMDVWVKLSGKGDNGRKRNVTLVATVIKKACSNRDRHYTRCAHTKACIRNELFCDGRSNCAWPNGDFATDEVQCSGYLNYNGSLSGSNSDMFKPANIPVIIIVVIVVIGVIIIFIVAARTFYRNVLKEPLRSQSSSTGGGRRRRRPSLEVTPALLHHPEGQVSDGPPSAPPSASFEASLQPPSYEEVIGATGEGRQNTSGQPPPYSLVG